MSAVSDQEPTLTFGAIATGLYREDPSQCPEPISMIPFWHEPKDKWPTKLEVAW